MEESLGRPWSERKKNANEAKEANEEVVVPSFLVVCGPREFWVFGAGTALDEPKSYKNMSLRYHCGEWNFISGPDCC